jgi:prepilin-type N-terminal cleavage/methylation domain-containing protein
MMRKSRRSQGGFSLIEVVIASIILAAVMFMTYTILFATSKTAQRGQMTSDLESRGVQFVELCKSQFYDAQFNYNNLTLLGIHNYFTQIHYQVSVSQNTTGNVTLGYPVTQAQDANAVAVYGMTASNPLGANYSCILRFEPEIVLYEGASGAPTILQPVEEDPCAPPWHVNPYTLTVPVSGSTALPSKSLNIDINGNGTKTDVFVQGKIWKYVIAPWSPPKPAFVVSSGIASDYVILAVMPNGTFTGEVDGPTPVGQPVGKDYLFRYLLAEPIPPTTYGNTELFFGSSGASKTYPGPNDVGLSVTIWHGMLDDTAKGFFYHKSWERMPFRLAK